MKKVFNLVKKAAKWYLDNYSPYYVCSGTIPPPYCFK